MWGMLAAHMFFSQDKARTAIIRQHRDTGEGGIVIPSLSEFVRLNGGPFEANRPTYNAYFHWIRAAIEACKGDIVYAYVLIPQRYHNMALIVVYETGRSLHKYPGRIGEMTYPFVVPSSIPPETRFA